MCVVWLQGREREGGEVETVTGGAKLHIFCYFMIKSSLLTVRRQLHFTSRIFMLALRILCLHRLTQFWFVIESQAVFVPLPIVMLGGVTRVFVVTRWCG